VVIDDFYIVGTVVGPDKADPPLVVDSNAVLAHSVAFENFQTVSWRATQVIEPVRNRKLRELPKGRPLNVDPPGHALTLVERLSVSTKKGLDRHALCYRDA